MNNEYEYEGMVKNIQGVSKEGLKKVILGIDEEQIKQVNDLDLDRNIKNRLIGMFKNRTFLENCMAEALK